MPKSGGAVILMQKNSTNIAEQIKDLSIDYQVGSPEILEQTVSAKIREPFSDDILDFLNTLSKILLGNREAKAYPDVVTLAFWMRKTSMEGLKTRFTGRDSLIRLGRGIAFHIAPSNVPVNYAYSLVSGLVCGNINIVRLPSKDFLQVRIINAAILQALQEYPEMESYILLVKYGHDSKINDFLSGIADVRIVWGGDATISELRKSHMKPRAAEITFADRYSLAVINADSYLESENKEKTAIDFYNDTFLTDQNACTSPRIVIWTGKQKEEAKELFWKQLYHFVSERYELQGVQAVNKLTSGYLAAASLEGVQKISMPDNFIVRIKVEKASSELMKLKDNSGYFFEYDCDDILSLQELCDDTRCQTLSYIGDKEMFLPLVKSGIKGIDRIVPIGKTMDFDLIWDGYNLFERMTRSIFADY